MAQPDATAIQTVVDTIQQLYQPGRNPDEIQQIQDSLQAVQRSEEGWHIADLLLHNEDQNVRFFGALTYTVKINQSTSFNEVQAREVWEKLLGWIKRSVSYNEGALVTNKLSSTLVTLFLRRDVIWSQCIPRLMYTFCYPGDEVTTEENIDGTLGTSSLVSNMTSQQIRVTLELATTLCDEANKLDLNSPLQNSCSEKIQANVAHTVALIQFSLQKTEHRCQALRCFGSWVKFAGHAWIQSSEYVQALQTLTRPALEYLHSPHMLPTAVNTFREILDQSPLFLLGEDRAVISLIIRSDFGRERFDLLEEQDFDTTQLALLTLSLANECIVELVESVQDQANGGILGLVHHFLSIPRSEDYGFLTQVVEFWVRFAEYMIDELPARNLPEGENEPAQNDARRAHLLQACEESLTKSRYPRFEQFKEWENEDYEEHNVFRYEVADLLRLSATFAPRWALTELAKSAVHALSHELWIDLEASLWAITVLAENAGLTVGGKDMEALKAVMESPVFSAVLRPDVQNAPGLKTTTIDLLGKYGKYFQKYPEHLLGALRFLFACLESSTETATVAARSIAELCTACRESLVISKNELIEQYRTLRSWPTVDIYAKEKIIGGLAAIVQATTPEFDGLENLLQFVEDDITMAVQWCNNNDREQGQNHALCALQCLLSIARGLQPPTHVLIDLEADAGDSQLDLNSANQQRICSDIAKAVQLIPSGEIVEAACGIFKSGFRHRNGPFAFPPALPVDFICQTNVHTPRLESILSMGSSLLLATDVSREQTAQLLQHVGQLMHTLKAPSQDPEIAESLVEIANNILRYREGALIPEIPTELLNLIFDFAMQSLSVADILPKRAAANFWVSLCNSEGLPSDHERYQAVSSPFPNQYPLLTLDSLQTTILKIPLPTLRPLIPLAGPPLAAVLTAQITMHATRADLDALIPPLRHLLTASPTALSWFATAVQSDAVITEPQVRVRLEEGGMGQRFVTHLGTAARTGGGRMVGRTVREFWAACRGTVAGLGRVGGTWNAS